MVSVELNDSRPLLFISHVTSDGEPSRILQQALDDRFLGALRFFNTDDRQSLRPGDHWFSSILDALRQCEVLLAVFSPDGLRSPWVNFESGAAWLRGALVIPCCAGQVRKDNLPAPYNSLQAINLDSSNDLALLIRRVAEKIGLRTPEQPLETLADQLRKAFQSSSTAPSVDVAALGNRIDKRVGVEWRYRRSAQSVRRWGATYRAEIDFEVLEQTVDHVRIDLTPSTEAVPFSIDNRPAVQLLKSSRSSPGAIRLGNPYKATGAAFAFRVNFEPPLQQGDTANVGVSIEIPEYRLGVREDLVGFLLKSGSELRDYDFNSRTILRPTERYEYRVILPKSLGATPLAPEVLRNTTSFDDEQGFVRSQPGVFSISEEELDGDACWVMKLRRDNPPFRASYRLRWRLPSEVDVGVDELPRV
jgi:TIR domain